MFQQLTQIDFKALTDELKNFEKIIPALEAELRGHTEKGFEIGITIGVGITSTRRRAERCMDEYASPSLKQKVTEILQHRYDGLVEDFHKVKHLLSPDLKNEYAKYLNRIGQLLGRNEQVIETQDVARDAATKFLEAPAKNSNTEEKLSAATYVTALHWIHQKEAQIPRTSRYRHDPRYGPSVEELKGLSLPSFQPETSGFDIRDFTRICAIKNQKHYPLREYLDELIGLTAKYDQSLHARLSDLQRAHAAFQRGNPGSHPDAAWELEKKIEEGNATLPELKEEARELMQRIEKDASILGVPRDKFNPIFQKIENANNLDDFYKGVRQLASFCFSMSWGEASVMLDQELRKHLASFAPFEKLREEITDSICIDENNQLRVDPGLFSVRYERVTTSGYWRHIESRHVVQLGDHMRKAVENHNLVARKGRLENLELAFIMRCSLSDFPEMAESARRYTYEDTKEIVEQTLNMLTGVRELSTFFAMTPTGGFFSVKNIAEQYSAALLTKYREFLTTYSQGTDPDQSIQKFRELIKHIRDCCDITRGFFAHLTHNKQDVLLRSLGDEGIFLLELLDKKPAA